MEEAVGVRNGRDFSEGCWQHTVNDNKLVQRGLRVKHCAKCLNILTHHTYAASQSLSLCMRPHSTRKQQKTGPKALEKQF